MAQRNDDTILLKPFSCADVYDIDLGLKENEKVELFGTPLVLQNGNYLITVGLNSNQNTSMIIFDRYGKRIDDLTSVLSHAKVVETRRLGENRIVAGIIASTGDYKLATFDLCMKNLKTIDSSAIDTIDTDKSKIYVFCADEGTIKLYSHELSPITTITSLNYEKSSFNIFHNTKLYNTSGKKINVINTMKNELSEVIQIAQNFDGEVIICFVDENKRVLYRLEENNTVKFVLMENGLLICECASTVTSVPFIGPNGKLNILDTGLRKLLSFI